MDIATRGFATEHAHSAYIAAICKRNATYAFNITSQVTNSEKKDFKNLHKMITAMLNSGKIIIMFLPLDLDSICMPGFVDAGFVSNPDSCLQPLFIITLM